MATWNFSKKVDAITKVLNEDWNPYGDPPERLAKYPYSKSARRLAFYIFLNNPTEDEVAVRISNIECDWKLITRKEISARKEKLKRVACLVLAAYHQGAVPSSYQSPKADSQPVQETPPK